MGVNIDEILQSLEQEKTAEANFADNLNTETPAIDSNSTEKVASDNTEDTPSEVEISEDEMAKIAADCDAQGRIMARSFVNEINKIASDDYSEEEYVEEGVEAPEANVEESTEAEKVAEEYTPQERIIGNLYNNYFGGEE